MRQIGLADSGLSHVDRAIAWIRDNYAEPMRIDDLARLSGMSVSAFHRHFRGVTAMSPLQFQKRIRLQHARSLLVAHPGDIAGVGHHVDLTARHSSTANTGVCSALRPARTRNAYAPRRPWLRRCSAKAAIAVATDAKFPQ